MFDDDDLFFDYEPYDVPCAGCGRVLSCEAAIIEEGDRWECPECWEKFEAEERASYALYVQSCQNATK